MPTRRASLIAVGMFVVGVSLGGAGGFAAGVSPVCDAVGQEAELDMPAGLVPTGDAGLDELHRLALEAPLAELVERADVFAELIRHHCRDAILWRGIERLADAVIADPAFPNRRAFARVLAQAVEQGDVPYNNGVLPKARQLRSVR